MSVPPSRSMSWDRSTSASPPSRLHCHNTAIRAALRIPVGACREQQSRSASMSPLVSASSANRSLRWVISMPSDSRRTVLEDDTYAPGPNRRLAHQARPSWCLEKRGGVATRPASSRPARWKGAAEAAPRARARCRVGLLRGVRHDDVAAAQRCRVRRGIAAIVEVAGAADPDAVGAGPRVVAVLRPESE